MSLGTSVRVNGAFFLCALSVRDRLQQGTATPVGRDVEGWKWGNHV